MYTVSQLVDEISVSIRALKQVCCCFLMLLKTVERFTDGSVGELLLT